MRQSKTIVCLLVIITFFVVTLVATAQDDATAFTTPTSNDIASSSTTPSLGVDTGDDTNIPNPDNARYHVRILHPPTPADNEPTTPTSSQLLRHILVPSFSNMDASLESTTGVTKIPCGTAKRQVVDPSASTEGKQFVKVGEAVSPRTQKVISAAVKAHINYLADIMFPNTEDRDFDDLLQVHSGDLDAAYDDYRATDGITGRASAGEVDAHSLEVDGWQPMALPNGTQYICKIPSIADYYDGGGGSYRGEDDILVDLAQWSEEDVKSLLQETENAASSTTSTSSSSWRAAIKGALFREILDHSTRKKVVQDLLKIRTSAQYITATNRDTVEEAMKAAAVVVGEEKRKSKKNAQKGGGGASLSTDPTPDEISDAMKLLKKGEKIPSLIQRIFEKRLMGNNLRRQHQQARVTAKNLKDVSVVPHTTTAPLPNNCFQQNAGWWTYEYCFGQHVAEFHLERGQGEAGMGKANILGLGPDRNIDYGASHDDIYYMTDSIRGPYFSTVYYNGTTCDKTLEQRAVEIRMYCANSVVGRSRAAADAASATSAALGGAAGTVDAKVTSLHVSEPETCKYIIWVGSPHFCIDAIRQIHEGPTVQVNCRRVEREPEPTFVL